MAEAAGVALAVLPLLISAIEHYEGCLKPVRRFCKFVSQAQRFQKKFDTQRTIFRNQCLLLLLDVLEQETVQFMMTDKANPSWSDRRLDHELQERLGASQDTCISTIEEIASVLRRLQDWSSGLNSAIERVDEGHALGSKAWRSVTRTKLRFSFSEATLDEALLELKELNDSFQTLYSQTAMLYKQQSRNNALVRDVAKEIETIKCIQTASRRVYEALGKSCSKHSEHETHFCLEAKTSGPPESPQVQFRVAFTRMALQGATDTCDPIFFVVESTYNDSLPERPPSKLLSDETVGNRLKRLLESEPVLPSKKVKKSVRFPDVHYNKLDHELSTTEMQDLKDLCKTQNFCDRLRECFQQSSNSLQCIGILGSSVPYKHSIRLTESKKRRATMSLQDVILTSSRQELSVRMSIYERLHLARSLATAVLQYYATPWLSNPWKSDNIYFFDIQERLSQQKRPVPISDPHINIPIKKLTPCSSASVTKHKEHLAPNVVLFNLGVMLIELGYMSTFRNLLNRKELSYKDNQYTELFAARRLGAVVGREMGPKYGKIVEKCIGGHFASGADLSSSELQTEYYRDVVKELESLEKDLADLSLNS